MIRFLTVLRSKIAQKVDEDSASTVLGSKTVIQVLIVYKPKPAYEATIKAPIIAKLAQDVLNMLFTISITNLN